MQIIFVSESIEKATKVYLERLGYMIEIPSDQRFYKGVESHPDLVLTVVGQTVIVDAQISENVVKELLTLSIPFLFSHAVKGGNYPNNIALNGVVTPNYFIHNLSHTDQLLLEQMKQSGRTLIDVAQGYTKCNAVVLRTEQGSAIITSDKGIQKVLAKECSEIPVLAIESGSVKLPPFDYGFLGGASGQIGKKVVFHGSLNEHPNGVDIRNFIEAQGLECVDFPEIPLADIGSILCYEVADSIKSSTRQHVNIPIFISHAGCPNDCVFCNQRKITASEKPMTLEEIDQQVERYLESLKNKEPHIELAFFGGSFTGIDVLLQEAYLSKANQYKTQGMIHEIRLSTRPDYINDEVINRLRHYQVDTVELGVQSFDTEVLVASKRGHSAEQVRSAVKQLQEASIKVGIQLMIGLPKDTKEKSISNMKKAIELKPDFFRIYPTLVISETQLYEQAIAGSYTPLLVNEAVEWLVEMLELAIEAHIPVIRIGLQPTDLIQEGKAVQFGPFHPAMRELVDTAYFGRKVEQKIHEWRALRDIPFSKATLKVYVHKKARSAISGQHRHQIKRWESQFKKVRIIECDMNHLYHIEVQICQDIEMELYDK